MCDWIGLGLVVDQVEDVCCLVLGLSWNHDAIHAPEEVFTTVTIGSETLVDTFII